MSLQQGKTYSLQTDRARQGPYVKPSRGWRGTRSVNMALNIGMAK